MLLQKMGANVKGIGTHTLLIEGREKLEGASFDICPDLLEAGTFLIAFALTGGQGRIKNINVDHLTFFLEKTLLFLPALQPRSPSAPSQSLP